MIDWDEDENDDEMEDYSPEMDEISEDAFINYEQDMLNNTIISGSPVCPDYFNEDNDA